MVGDRPRRRDDNKWCWHPEDGPHVFRTLRADWINYSGLRAIGHRFAPQLSEQKNSKPPSTGMLWLVGIYVALFGLASQRYEHGLDRILNRQSGIFAQIGSGEVRTSLERVPTAQAQTRPREPDLKSPLSVLSSLVCGEVRDPDNVDILKELVVSNKHKLGRKRVEDGGPYEPGVRLMNADLSGANLIDADLAGSDLSDADLRRSKLWKADLSFATLRGTKFQDASLSNDTRPTEGSMRNPHLEVAILRSAIIPNGMFARANLGGVDLYDAHLRGADFQDSWMVGARLVHARLMDAKMIRAKLEHADFREAELIGTNLRNSTLCYANFDGARLVETDLRGSNLTNASFQDAVFSVYLKGANLSGATIRFSRITEKRLESFEILREQVKKACADPSNPPALPKEFELPPPCNEKHSWPECGSW